MVCSLHPNNFVDLENLLLSLGCHPCPDDTVVQVSPKFCLLGHPLAYSILRNWIYVGIAWTVALTHFVTLRFFYFSSGLKIRCGQLWSPRSHGTHLCIQMTFLLFHSPPEMCRYHHLFLMYSWPRWRSHFTYVQQSADEVYLHDWVGGLPSKFDSIRDLEFSEHLSDRKYHRCRGRWKPRRNMLDWRFSQPDRSVPNWSMESVSWDRTTQIRD